MSQPEPFGKYLLLGQVAVGGMAEIYKARYADPSMPQIDIALKRILPSYTEDEGFVTMFKDEGNIAIRLKHPNIVNIYEVGEVNGDWYIAMEYIQGTDMRVLSDACERYHRRFTNTQIARIICETAKALDYAHACTAADGTPLNIVHRDCTPHNIMVSHTGEVKLMDFGIAKAASRATKTRVGTVKGKSSYMSPEQARGKQLDGRSDMFTLGTVAWELLTGYRLFKANSDFDILTKVLKSEIHHPTELDSNVPQDLGDIIMKTLERDRDMRYASCGQLAQALESWLAVNSDRSDQRLGDVVMCLQNKRGHSFSELPEYHPGESQFNYSNGEFVRKAGAAPLPMSYSSPQQAAVSAPAMPVAPAAPTPAAFPQTGFPDPGMGQANAQAPRLTMGYIIGFVGLSFASICAIFFSLWMGLGDAEELPVYEAPEALVNFKTTPSDVTVTLNEKKLMDENGDFALTPIYAHKSKLGEKYSITFEKKGYEPVTIERYIVLTSQDIDVELKTEEEAKLAALDYIPEFEIRTDPPGAIITVDGNELGESPVTVKELKFGSEIKIAAKSDGYELAERTFTAMKGGDTSLKLVLEKEEKAVAKAAPAPKPKPAAAKPKAGGSGTISIKAVPWATVSINGSRVGNTPVNKKLKAGTHSIQLKLPNKNKTVNKKVTVKADTTTSVGYNFNTDKWM